MLLFRKRRARQCCSIQRRTLLVLYSTKIRKRKGQFKNSGRIQQDCVGFQIKKRTEGQCQNLSLDQAEKIRILLVSVSGLGREEQCQNLSLDQEAKRRILLASVSGLGREEKNSASICQDTASICTVSGLGREEKDSASIQSRKGGEVQRYSIKSRYREREHCTNIHTVCKFQSIWQRFR